mgnify:CR=1
MTASTEPQERGTMPFLAHVAELRRRLIICLLAAGLGMIVAWFGFKPIMEFLQRPLASDKIELASLHYLEQFMLRLRISVYGGILLAAPVHVYHLVAFVRPALKQRERRALAIALPVSFCLSAAGAVMAYAWTLPTVVDLVENPDFMLDGVVPLANITTTIAFEVKVIMAFVILFQFPLVLEVLMALGLVTRQALWRAGRFVIIGIFFAAAVLTPPDIVTQVCLAIPLICFYFLAILVARLLNLGNAPAADATTTGPSGPA